MPSKFGNFQFCGKILLAVSETVLVVAAGCGILSALLLSRREVRWRPLSLGVELWLQRLDVPHAPPDPDQDPDG